MHATYEAAFAYWAPIYRDRYRDASRAKAEYARDDIKATVAVWGIDRTPYTGKLMAELDAVRERLQRLNAKRDARRTPQDAGERLNSLGYGY